MPSSDTFRRGYHDLPRRELMDLIPTSARKILDCGCGTGALGKALKERQDCYVHGIELVKEAAGIAMQHLDEVTVDNLNRYDPSFLETDYDCIVFADILEHLINPWQVIKKFAAKLTKDGVIIASIPNIAHPWIVSQLQKGLFRYEAAGILDATHLRFFTKTTIFQMFYRAGLKILNIRPWLNEKNPVQYHVSAVKPILEHEHPLVTIFILTFNGWAYTKQCLDSIKNYTSLPYKIVVIDNGSTDETVFNIRRDPTIFNIENSCNLGFARGFNIGLEMIDTPYFTICNNDIVVTSGWLTELVRHIDTDKELMILGPVSNHVSGPQLVPGTEYQNIEQMHGWAWQRKAYITDPLEYYHRIVFFCTLFKSDIIGKIGLLDERFDMGNFEDDDYCLRAKARKIKAAIDRSVFIHHYGERAFIINKIDFAKAMNENKQRFAEKWNIPTPENSQNRQSI